MALLVAVAFAGCMGGNGDANRNYGARADFGHGDGRYDTDGLDPGAWPDLPGANLTILGNGAFEAFDDAAAQFERLTGVTVHLEDGGDSITALRTLRDSKADGSFDVIYGLDNMILGQAVNETLLVPYKPMFAPRVDPAHVFFPSAGAWPATPVDHGYIAVNVDEGNPALGGADIDGLGDLRRWADEFITQNPTTSTPGLGFLIITVAAFPEAPEGSLRYDWRDYWTDLFTGKETDRDRDGTRAGCVAVVDDWGLAYEGHFSGGYGAPPGGSGRADKAIVTSYTESPAFEHSFGRDKEDLARVILEPNATFHQVQTMAIAKGTRNLEAAQAWIEFTLTGFFQGLAAPQNGVYPVVPGISVASTYQGLDPAPGTFQDAKVSYATINKNLRRWTEEWTDLREEHDCTQASF